MFNFRSFAPVAVAVATLAIASAAQAEQLRIQNNSGMTILRIYASPISNNSWENDILGANVLYAGQYLDVNFENVYECNYDVLIQWENGAEATDVVNICTVGTLNVN